MAELSTWLYDKIHVESVLTGHWSKSIISEMSANFCMLRNLWWRDTTIFLGYLGFPWYRFQCVHFVIFSCDFRRFAHTFCNPIKVTFDKFGIGNIHLAWKCYINLPKHEGYIKIQYYFSIIYIIDSYQILLILTRYCWSGSSAYIRCIKRPTMPCSSAKSSGSSSSSGWSLWSWINGETRLRTESTC